MDLKELFDEKCKFKIGDIVQQRGPRFGGRTVIVFRSIAQSDAGFSPQYGLRIELHTVHGFHEHELELAPTATKDEG